MRSPWAGTRRVRLRSKPPSSYVFDILATGFPEVQMRSPWAWSIGLVGAIDNLFALR